ERWFKAVLPLLKNYYGTGGDLNVDEIHEVIAITQNLGLLHPQEGVVRGHFGESDSSHSGKDIAAKRIDRLRVGVSKKVDDPAFVPKKGFTVSDMITGYGVAESVRHYYSLWGGAVSGKRALIQGWGNVASAAAYYLAQMGVKITGIIDREGGLLNPEGFSADEITSLFNTKKGNKLFAPAMLSATEAKEKIWDCGAEIFIPAASSRLVKRGQLDTLCKNGLEVISCGANVPFADKEIFFGAIGEYADNRVSVIPDFIANCGMARVFAYLMSENAELNDKAIFGDVSRTIHSAMEKTLQENPAKTRIAQTAFGIALKQLIA
ncbi:MAG TPA: amino acid dehydrogenase, partial [Bacteroidia bacterium]|nr:amino acid dehydrogenase [Bacteroidia bacterium]